MVCFECGKTAVHRHHVVPRSMGGTRTVTLCEDCHSKVHNRKFLHWQNLHKKGVERAKKDGRFTGPKRSSKLNPRMNRAIAQHHRKGVSVTAIARKYKISRDTVYRSLRLSGILQ